MPGLLSRFLHAGRWPNEASQRLVLMVALFNTLGHKKQALNALIDGLATSMKHPHEGRGDESLQRFGGVWSG